MSTSKPSPHHNPRARVTYLIDLLQPLADKTWKPRRGCFKQVMFSDNINFKSASKKDAFWFSTVFWIPVRWRCRGLIQRLWDLWAFCRAKQKSYMRWRRIMAARKLVWKRPFSFKICHLWHSIQRHLEVCQGIFFLQDVIQHYYKRHWFRSAWQ